jgi:hypothetical protein
MKLTCLVTIHGIGFQQPPTNGNPGYADDLHKHLAAELGTALGDDPHRTEKTPSESGPVYVESMWPTDEGLPSVEKGLERLGSWDTMHPGQLEENPPPLVAPDGPASIAHVALVYSRLELRTPQPGASFEAVAETALNLINYEPIHTLAHSALLDVKALLCHPRSRAPLPVSLRPRTDTRARSDPEATSDTPPSGVAGTIVQLENDVAAYVAQNSLRERVRAFMTEALLRLAARPDIAAIVVNGHSQGTVASFDVLRDLHTRAETLQNFSFVSAGSPLRKYRDLFAWGDEVGAIHGLRRWTNYCDDSDPVGDPLARCNPAEEAEVDTLFRWVDNLTYCVHPGGLQAHNYWDNIPQFVRPLSVILKETDAEPRTPQSFASTMLGES